MPPAGERVELPRLEHLHAFLARHCKRERFEGRDGPVWGHRYSWRLAEAALEDLRMHGASCISRHASVTGQAVWFGPDLVVRTAWEAPR